MVWHIVKDIWIPWVHAQRSWSLFYKLEDGELLFVTVYVDDKLIFSKNLNTIKHLKAQLLECFEITDLGEACWILGMKVIHDHKLGTISLSQCRYITMILDHFGLKDSWSVSTPLETNVKLVKVDNSEVDIKTYQSALGGLMYAMLATHPDLAYAVGALSKHAACPGQAHFAALKQVYRYLRRMTDTRLIYRRTTFSIGLCWRRLGWWCQWSPIGLRLHFRYGWSSHQLVIKEANFHCPFQHDTWLLLLPWRKPSGYRSYFQKLSHHSHTCPSSY